MNIKKKNALGIAAMKHSILLIALIAMCGLFVAANHATAQSFWDPAHHHVSPGSGGAGLWNNTTANWWVSGSTDVPWTPDNTAAFEGSAGNITLGPVLAPVDSRLPRAAMNWVRPPRPWCLP